MPRVDMVTLTQPKSKGDVGLIPFVTPVQNLLAKVILFAMEEQEEVHPLQKILKVLFKKLSRIKWGVDDFSWVINECKNQQYS